MNLIGDDYALSYEIGSDATLGIAPGAFGTSVSMTTNGQATFNRTRLRARGDSTNVKGGGDARVRNRYHSKSREFEIESMVPSQIGFQFLDFQFHYIRVTFTPHSTLLPTRVVIGVITEVEAEGQQGDAQSETVTIDLDPDVDLT